MSAPEDRRYGDWSAGDFLGEGSVGRVYAASDGERQAALKVLRPPVPLHADEVEAVWRRLDARLGAIGALAHPGIVTVWDRGHDPEDGLFWYAMERVVGRPLDIARTYSDALVAHIAGRIVEGLALAHEHGVLHGDIKPHNVLVASEQRVVLIDWALDLAPEPSPAAPGSPLWLAPECFDGAPLSAAVDVYAVGQCLHEALTSRAAFQASGRGIGRILHLRTLKEERPHLDPGRACGALRDVVIAATDRDPDRRPSASELREGLHGMA